MSESKPGPETRIDRIATAFDRAWHEDRRPRIEDYLGVADDDVRPLLTELLRIELQHRRRLGESPTVAEYDRRFLKPAEAVHDAFRAEGLPTGPTDGLPATVTRRPEGIAEVDPDRTLTYSCLRPDGEIRPLINPAHLKTLVTTFPPGTTLQGRYVVEEELGRGGMGLVYRGRDRRLGDRPVAIKVILPDAKRGTIREANVRAAFEEEARLGANLVHPAIATVYDFGLHNDVPFTVFEYIPGETLGSLLRRRRQLPLDEVRLIVGTLSQALDFAHSRHIIHRDLKPENIRATEQGQFKILDLGLARRFLEANDWSGFAGTPAYAAPEQAAGKPCDGRSDQYALALIVYELLTGQRPFTARSVSEILEKHRSEEPPIPRTTPPLPEIAVAAILKALHKAPTLRHNSCEEFAVALGCRLLSDTKPEARVEAEGTAYDARHLPRFLAALFPQMSRVHLILTSDALWMIHRGSIVKWPRRSLCMFYTSAPGFLQLARLMKWSIPDASENQKVLSFFIKDAEHQIPVSLHFASSSECKEWREHLVGCSSKEWRDRLLGPMDSSPVTGTRTQGKAWIWAVLGAFRLTRGGEADTGLDRDVETKSAPPLLTIDPSDVRRIISPNRMGDDDPAQPSAIEERFPVALVKGRPIHRHQVLGPVEVVHERNSTANAMLQLRGAMAGADAVMSIQRERLRGYGRDLTRVSGLAILAVDGAGRGELRSRWLASQVLSQCIMCFNFLLINAFIVFVCLQCVVVRHLRFEDTLLLVGLLYGVPLSVIALMTVLRWPQLMRGMAVATLFVAVSCLIVELASAILAGRWAYSFVETIVETARGQGRRRLVGLIVMGIALLASTIWYQFRFASYITRLLFRIQTDYRMVASELNEPDARWRTLVGRAALMVSVLHAIPMLVVTVAASVSAHPILGPRLGPIGPSTDPPFILSGDTSPSPAHDNPLKEQTKAREDLGKLSKSPSVQETRRKWLRVEIDLAQVGALFEEKSDANDLIEALAKAERVLTDCEKSAEIHPKDSQSLRRLAEAQNVLASLIATYEISVPDSRRLNLNEFSVTMAKEAVRLEPQKAEFWSTLGLSQYAAEDFPAAIQSLEQAVRLRPESDHSDGFVLAAVHWRLNERHQAQSHYRKAVEWMDKHKPSEKAVARLRRHFETIMNESRRD